MDRFFSSFEKRAEESKKKKSNLPMVAGLLAGTAAGLGAYKLLRRGGKHVHGITNLSKSQPRYSGWRGVGDYAEPKTTIGKKIENLMYGYDTKQNLPLTGKGAYLATPGRYAINKKVLPKILAPKDTGGRKIVVSTDIHHISDKRYIDRLAKKQNLEVSGRVVGDKTLDKINRGKREESKWLNTIVPELHAKTHNISSKDFSHAKNIQRFHNRLKKTHGEYLIKPTRGQQSGEAGKGFLDSNDMERILQNKNLSPKKHKLLKDVIDNPKGYLAQERHNLVKSKVTGKPIEYRVHTVGHKVVDAYSRFPHFGITEKAKASETAQKFLKKVPKHIKDKNTMFNLDVAKTDKGFKIMETNPNSANSGLRSPHFMLVKQGPIKGIGPALSAIKARQNLYKHVAGRPSQLEAGVKGIGAGGAAAAATAATTSALSDRERK